MVLNDTASISIPTAIAPASSAALNLLMISILKARGLKIGMPRPPNFLITSRPIRYLFGLAPSPTIPIVPILIHPLTTVAAYSFSSIPPARLVSMPVIGAASMGIDSFCPNRFMDKSGSLILWIVRILILYLARA